MTLFMQKSKRKAKARLIDCIKRDRDMAIDCRELSYEIEKLFKKYTRLDLDVRVEIIHKDRNKRYIQAEACIKI